MSKQDIAPFSGNLILRGKIEAVTGLHIGGSQEKMQIGGVDLVVIRHPKTEYPYIPGSSLKGKLRHLLEYATGEVNNPFEGALGNVSVSDEIVRMFGIGAEVTEFAHAEEKDQKKAIEEAKSADKRTYLEYVRDNLKNIGPARLIVRDAMPDDTTTKMWEDLGSDSNFTEYKAENTIDRLTSAANPRFVERVVAGSTFDFEIIYTAFGKDAELVAKDVSNLIGAMKLLENSALGKSGTRGYGQVRFHLAEPVWLYKDDYFSSSEKFSKVAAPLKQDELSPLLVYMDKFPPFNPGADA